MTHVPSRSSVFLSGLATLLLALAVGTGLVVVVGGAFGFGMADQISAHTTVDAKDISNLPDYPIVSEEVEVIVRIPDPSAEQRRWFALRDLPSGIVLIAAIWFLRGLLKSVRDGVPFTSANVDRLRGLAMLVLIGIPVAQFMSSILASELADSAGLVGTEIRTGISSTTLLGGLAILVLSEVFAEGLRMREDLEGTV